ncbi:MAG: rhodanese-like domain-containing protein [Chitinophagales bacterium]|nr:rhodanese-like domain-containing protein [Chitinophagaceae bacterium]MCB9065841.1 rhodanese-like domain-containing protein [Chitinophagales bacterium]
MNNIQQIINDANTTIVDVRTREEFAGGHVAGSINIPLQEVQQRIGELKDIDGNIVLCCASGGRSNMCMQFMRQAGFSNVYDGGGWMQVNGLLN